MPVDVYLARSHAVAKWCQHLFVLPFAGSWSFFCFFMSHTLDSISSSCPNNLIICSSLRALVNASCRSLGLTRFASFPSSLFYLSKKCTFTWTCYLSQSKDMKTAFSSEDGQFYWLLVLCQRMQQERYMLKKHHVIYLHAQALEILWKWMFSILYFSIFLLSSLLGTCPYLQGFFVFCQCWEQQSAVFWSTVVETMEHEILHMKHVYI